MSNVTKTVCRCCCLSQPSSVARRSFATSSTRCVIPPESPNYIDIPDTFQTDFLPPRRPKGILPVPREIFSAQQPDKPSKEYLARAIPPQKKSTKSTTRMSEQDQYKARMTDLRRQHLRAGLLELYNRKVVTTQEMAKRSSTRQKERARLMTQPLREDERLTNTSIPSTMRITSTHSSSALIPNSPTTALSLHGLKTANVTAQQTQKAESRRDALHTLYMNARTFITDEKQLAAELEQAFDYPETEWKSLVDEGGNIWNRDVPATIATLLDERSSDRASVRSNVHRESTQRYRTDQERMKRLAEVLSGGKM